MPEWILPTLAFAGGCATTYLLLRIRFERFEAMDTRREQDWKAWRGEVDRKLAALNGALLERVDRLEEEIGDHEHGMRGDIHSHAAFIHYHGLCIWTLANKAGLSLPPMDKKR